MERPFIAGVGGGVGTTTLAAALAALDREIYRAGTPVDLLVARATMYSLGCAQRAIAVTPAPPLLAVVAAGPGTSLPGVVKTRLRMTEPHLVGVVYVPYVVEWDARDDPHFDAAAAVRTDQRSKPMRAFAAAVQELIGLLAPRIAQRIHSAPPPPGTPSPATAPGTPGTRFEDPLDLNSLLTHRPPQR